MIPCLLGLALALWPAAPAQGQLSITAEVNKTQVTLDDQVVLVVTVTGPQASLPDPQLPPMQNFSVYSSGRNQSISFVNGRVASSVTNTFLLVPRVVGRGLIPAIVVSIQGASAQTEPIEIQVVRPGGASPGPPPGQAPVAPAAPQPGARPQGRAPGAAGSADVFMTMELDRPKAFVNEQVTLSVKFFTAVSLMANPEYVPPKLESFLTEDLPPLRHYNVVRGGRTYYVTEIKTALFPLQAGRLKIGAAAVRCQIQQDVSVDPFSPDFFDKFFSQGLSAPQTRSLSAQPLALEVLPLPAAGKPQDFSGAVGRFSISASVDKDRAKVGDAVNLTLTVQGTGNLKALGDPALPEMPSWRAFDPVTSVNQEKRGDLVTGSRVIRTVLVPRVSGDLTIPAVPLWYFDSGKKEYVRLLTPPLAVSVAPGSASPSPMIGYTSPTEASAQGVTRVNEDLAYLKTRPERAPLTRALEGVASAGPVNALPLLFFLWALGAMLYRERLASDPRGARFRGAWKAAAARVRAAGRAQDPQKAAGQLTEALTGYLADKLGEPAAGMTMRRAAELLQLRQVPEASIERVRSLWEDLDARRFAPPAAEPAEKGPGARGELMDLLKSLERELKR